MQKSEKTICYEELATWRATIGAQRRQLVVTNGCFDLLHPGHLFLLQKARALGDALLVGVTGDAAIRSLKGPGRPAIPEHDRVMVLCGLEAVTYVCLFPEVDAAGFLTKANPDIYVKGGDYTIDTINQEERRILEQIGSRIEILPKMGDFSTTAVMARIAANASGRMSV